MKTAVAASICARYGLLLRSGYARSGVDPKTMQGLLRHSSPALTLKVYVHFDQARMSAAMMNLPDAGT